MRAIPRAEIANRGRRRGGLDMKKIFAAVVTAIFITATFATVLAANYVGNANSKKFHVGNCSFVGKMNTKNRVDFQTRDEAIQAGYVPCKRCNP